MKLKINNAFIADLGFIMNGKLTLEINIEHDVQKAFLKFLRNTKCSLNYVCILYLSVIGQL